MSSYIIAGSADNPETARCEYIADAIQAINKKVDIRTIIKHGQDWDSYINSICRTYGFKHKDNPIVFQTNGQLIGNTDDFCQFAEANFGVSIDLVDTKQRNEIINIKQAQKEFVKTGKINSRKRTIKEKIRDKLYELTESKVLKELQPNYKEVKDHGIILYTTREIKTQIEYPLALIQEPPNINKNEQEERIQLNIEEMYKRDYYENPEDGLKNIRAEEDEQQQQQGAPGGKKKKHKDKDKEKENTQEITEDKKESLEQTENFNVSQPEEGKILEGEQQIEQIPGEGLNEEQQIKAEDEKVEEVGIEEMGGESPMIDNKKIVVEIKPEKVPMSQFVIKKLKDGYYFALHPDPIINGQCVIFEDIGIDPLNENQENEEEMEKKEWNEIYLADYSKIGKIRKNRPQVEKPGNISNTVSLEIKQQYKSNLNNSVINIFNPFSLIDLEKCCDVLRLLQDGYIVYQLLPEDGQTPFSLQSNIINVFEKNALTKARLNQKYFSEQNNNDKTLKHQELPFDKYFTSECINWKEFEYKKERKDKEGKGKKEFKNVVAKFQENCQLPRPHLIATHNLTAKSIQKLIFQMILYFKGDLNHSICQTGYTILLTSKRLYLGLLQSPIEIPPPFKLYLPPISALGFLHFPIAGKFEYEGHAFEIMASIMNKRDIKPKTEQEIEECKAKFPQLKYQTLNQDKEKELKQILNTFKKEEKPKFKVKDVVII